MERIIYHVTFDRSEQRWKVARQSEENALSWFGRDIENPKEAAIKKAVQLARKDFNEGRLSQVIIHNKNGKIHSERTYGKDPRATKG